MGVKGKLKSWNGHAVVYILHRRRSKMLADVGMG